LNQGKKAVTHEGFVMVNRANDSWGTVTRSPPVYYITTDAPVLAVSSTKEAMDLAIDAWGNFGPVEVNIIGSSVNAALELEAEYSARHEALDPLWNKEWDSPSTDPLSGYHTFTKYASSGNAAVSEFRRDYLSEDFFMLTMGTEHDPIYSENYQRIVMHEYWHVYQGAHVSDLDDSDSRTVNPREEKRGDLYWNEGGANWMALKLYDATHDMQGDYLLTQMENLLANNNALKAYKENGILLQDIIYGVNDNIGYAIGTWFIAYLESKHSAEDYSINFYDDLDSLGFEAAFIKTYGKQSNEYLDEFEVFINQPLEKILKIIPSNSTNEAVTEEVNVVVTTIGDLGSDIIHGTKSDDFLYGSSGDDLLIGRSGDDTLDGDEGTDAAQISATTLATTITFFANGIINVTDRIGSEGTDTLSSVETLFFSDRTLDLNSFSSLTNLSDAQFKELAEMYVAYFNRAPDAEGLFYWADKLAEGRTMDQIAERFFDQDETRALYTDPSNTDAFVTAVYANVLGRTPDEDGFKFWTGKLAAGEVTQGAFVLKIILGAKNGGGANDVAYLSDKADVGLYYSAIKGMSDSTDGRQVMAAFGDQSTANKSDAKTAVDGHYADATESGGGEFIFNVVGIVSDPFADFA
jgi:hypothetical protein